MKFIRFGLFILATPLAFAQTDLVFPWVTNSDLFEATIIVNNLNGEQVTVSMTATRADGTNQTTERTIEPFQQLVSSSGALFDVLGLGGGYSVRLTSTASNIEGAYIVSATTSPSGNSPSQANVVPASSASNLLLFNFLPVGGGFSAPVVINMGSATANVTFHAYQDGAEADTATVAIEPGHPIANLTSSLFPNLAGNLYVIAESDQPLIGVTFFFNDQREPSLSNAGAISALPDTNTGSAVSFANQIQPIFDQNCGGGSCHLNGQSASGLSLDSANSFSNLVNQDAVQVGRKRVAPGNADNSYLYQKMIADGSNRVGSRMPLGRQGLSEENLNLVRDWINQGAANN